MSDFDILQIRRLDGGLLLIFRELLAQRRATEVAARLGLSGSAVSHGLGRLRDVFGDPLFVRRPHGLEPTRRALELGPRIEAIVEQLGAAVSGVHGFDPAASRRRFNIACPAEVTTLIAAPLVAAFRATAPRVLFATYPLFLGRALTAVRRGEIDVAIGAFGSIPAGLQASRLFEDDYCVLARTGHPQVQRRIDAETYRTVGHVFVGAPEPLSDEAAVDHKLMHATYGRLPSPDQVRTHAYVSQWETAMLMAASSDALVDCPRSLARRFAPALGLQVLDLPFRPFRFEVQAVRRVEDNDAGVSWLLEQVRAAVAA